MIVAKDCDKCHNKRHIFKEGVGWVRCECIDELRADKLMSKSGLPEPLWSIDSRSFKPGDDSDRKVLANAIKKITDAYDKKPVFIYSTQPDKDRAAAIIARYTAILHPSVETISYIKLDKLVQRQFKKDVMETDFIDPVTADITILGIGDEITNKAHQNAIYTLLYDRILGERFTIVTSFVPKNRIVQIYHKAVDDLMKNNFSFYSC